MKDFSSTLHLETLVKNPEADKQSARFLSTAVIKHRAGLSASRFQEAGHAGSSRQQERATASPANSQEQKERRHADTPILRARKLLRSPVFKPSPKTRVYRHLSSCFLPTSGPPHA